MGFNREALSGIHIPLQIWRSELGGNGLGAKFTALTASQLPGSPEIHIVPAGHYAFLAPCSPQLAARVPRICTDEPASFDRVAFHRDFDARVVAFLREHLSSDGVVR